MGEQQRLAEDSLAYARDRIDGDPAQVPAQVEQLGGKGQRDQCRARRDDLEAELARDVIGEACRAELGDRRAARRQDQRGGGEVAVTGGNEEARPVVADAGDGVAEAGIDVRRVALIDQHRDDLPGRAVAEALAERLLVVDDAVLVDQRDEVGGGVPLQRRPREVLVLRQKAIGRGTGVGEVAPPAARDDDLPARLIGMVEQQDALAARPGGGRRHHPGRARAEDDGVEGACHLILPRLCGGGGPRRLAW